MKTSFDNEQLKKKIISLSKLQFMGTVSKESQGHVVTVYIDMKNRFELGDRYSLVAIPFKQLFNDDPLNNQRVTIKKLYHACLP